MDSKGYMNFDEAVEFLNTTRSTLYKWLQAGKVPGHKLGRQWRFLQSELHQYRDGVKLGHEIEKSLAKLENLLEERFNSRKEKEMESFKKVNSCEVAEKLIWDATSSGAQGIHLWPNKGQYEIAYRSDGPLETLTAIDKQTFLKVNDYLQEVSTPIKGENKRRFFLGKKVGEGSIDLHIRYQSLDTVLGPRVTLNIARSDHPADSLTKIAQGDDLKKLEKWSQKSHGLLVVTGEAGSGKTTTIHCLMHDLIREKKSVFTMEDPVSFIIDGANQVEVDMKNLASVEESFEQIYSSDLDVLCLFNTQEKEAREISEKIAIHAAKTGHLVILQLDNKNYDQAYKKLRDSLGEEIEEYLIGIVSQKLVKRKDKAGRKAVYDFFDGNL